MSSERITSAHINAFLAAAEQAAAGHGYTSVSAEPGRGVAWLRPDGRQSTLVVLPSANGNVADLKLNYEPVCIAGGWLVYPTPGQPKYHAMCLCADHLSPEKAAKLVKPDLWHHRGEVLGV